MKSDREMIERSNDMLRSAYQIAEREGVSTNWKAFKARLMEVLVEQSLYLNNTSHEGAASCTARNFKNPIINGVEVDL